VREAFRQETLLVLHALKLFDRHRAVQRERRHVGEDANFGRIGVRKPVGIATHQIHRAQG
jgi:hypothetical protein